MHLSVLLSSPFLGLQFPINFVTVARLASATTVLRMFLFSAIADSPTSVSRETSQPEVALVTPNVNAATPILSRCPRKEMRGRRPHILPIFALYRSILSAIITWCEVIQKTRQHALIFPPA